MVKTVIPLSVLFFPAIQPRIVMHGAARPAGAAQILITVLPSDGKACSNNGWSSQILLISAF